MCDITNLFKATIKTVKIREKSYNPSLIDKSILPKTNRKSEFTQNAKNVVFLISKLKEFLLEHRKDYLNAAGFFGLEQSVMSDLERDKIDTEAEAFMKKCKEAIHHLRLQVENHKVLRQVREHKDAVLGIIDRYLIAICKIYSEQKAIRVKRSVDRKRMARLQMEPIQSIVKPVKETPIDNKTVKSNTSETTRNKNNKTNQSKDDRKAIPPSEDVHREVEEIKELSNLTADESMMLQLENDQIFNELSTMVDEIKQLEGKIVEISRLQTIFTEKILEQEKDIEKVADTVVMTTENIKEANEVIREAMKNNAGFRVWVLFFLIVCTLSLLFLDWYNA